MISDQCLKTNQFFVGSVRFRRADRGTKEQLVPPVGFDFKHWFRTEEMCLLLEFSPIRIFYKIKVQGRRIAVASRRTVTVAIFFKFCIFGHTVAVARENVQPQLSAPPLY